MIYKLKPNQESFECTDGPFAGRKFLTGHTYTDIPPEEAGKFDEWPYSVQTSEEE